MFTERFPDLGGPERSNTLKLQKTEANPTEIDNKKLCSHENMKLEQTLSRRLDVVTISRTARSEDLMVDGGGGHAAVATSKGSGCFSS